MHIRVPSTSTIFFLVFTLSLSLPASSDAEWYVAGYGGLAVPDTLSNARVTQRFQRFGAVSEARVVDLELINSFALGAKLGFFSKERKWLGVEADLYTSSPFMSQQIAIVGSPGTSPTTFSAVVPGAHIRVTTLAFNVLTRDYTPDVKFQPYGGAGPGFFYTDSKDFPGRSNIRLGLSLIGGARYFFTDQLALFGEFKYNLARISFGGFSGNYSVQMFVGGISFHFQ